MGIILGWLCLLTFLGLLAKAVTRKLGLNKANRVLMKLHKPLSVAFLVICVLHILFVLPVFQTRAFSIYATGVGIVVVSLLLILLCHVMTKGKAQQIRWHRILSVIMLFLAIGHIVVYQVDFSQYKNSINSIEIENIDISSVPDGTYFGEYDAGYIYARVEVDVANGQISNIHLLEHRNEHGKPAEQIVSDILEQQSLQVDAVSGATNSSKVIKKAVEYALTEARHE